MKLRMESPALAQESVHDLGQCGIELCFGPVISSASADSAISSAKVVLMCAILRSVQ